MQLSPWVFTKFQINPWIPLAITDWSTGLHQFSRTEPHPHPLYLSPSLSLSTIYLLLGFLRNKPLKFPKCAWCRLPIDFGSTSLLSLLLLEAGLSLSAKYLGFLQLWDPSCVLSLSLWPEGDSCELALTLLLLAWVFLWACSENLWGSTLGGGGYL